MASARGSQGSTPRELVLWSLLVVALAPTWSELLRHIEVERWAGYALLVPVLLLWGAASSSPEPAQPRLGGALLATAMGVELVALIAGPERAGRVALPLGVLGMGALVGRPGRRFWPVALFLVPVPFAALRATSPGLETLWLRGGAALAGLLGRPVTLAGTGAVSPNGVLGLSPADGGLPLVALFAALGCFAAARADRPPLRALARGLVVSPLAFPTQALAVLVAVPLASGGHAAAARAALDYGLPVACALAGLALAGWRGAGRTAPARKLVAGALG